MEEISLKNTDLLNKIRPMYHIKKMGGVRIKILLLKEWWSKRELANVIYHVKLVII